MRKLFIYLFFVVTLFTLIFASNEESLSGVSEFHSLIEYFDEDEPDSTLIYPIKPESSNPYEKGYPKSPLYLDDPDNFTEEVIYNPETNEYEIRNKIGSLDRKSPRSMSFDDYIDYDFEKAMRNYWREKAKAESIGGQAGALPKLYINSEAFDRIFGGNTIDIKPQGSAKLKFGIKTQKTENSNIPERLRRTTTFDFQEEIQMNVKGKIGEKMNVSVVYNTEATFDYENSVKIEYTGHEDEILQKIEAGNVTLPLTGSLITGSQSLFGFKTEMKFGKLRVTTLFSQQKGETKVMEIEGGAQTGYFEVNADEYEANKHFFLSHYFAANYEKALSTLPIINSGINITKVEVWVTNKTGDFDNARNIVAFMDLGERDSIQSNVLGPVIAPELPQDSANNLPIVVDYTQLRNYNTANSYLQNLQFAGGVDFEKIESARRLESSEYKLNNKLGYISLNSSLNADEILAVAFEYTYNGKVYRVGEFSTGGVTAPDALVVKLIKGTSMTPRLMNWNLMMKNVYALGAYQVNPQDFRLNILYNNPQTGTPVNYLEEGEIANDILLQVMNLDNLNSSSTPAPDGMFDFIEQYTITASNGRIFFPTLEPFGNFLRKKITGGNPQLNGIADKYCYDALYDSTQSVARQLAEKNKFIIKGSYKSSSGSEISLNALNIPQGSVTVTAGGMQLSENIDYTVDYTLGRLKIINQGLLESGTPIKVSLESNALFSIQSKRLMGTHFSYEVNKDFNIGGAILNLNERPLTQKVSIGDEPINNTIWGVDASYRKEVPGITKAIDKYLPFVKTKAPSSIAVVGEFAHLIPGHSRAIKKEGNAYIDDFEGSKTSYDIKSYHAWVMASVPQGQESLFPYAGETQNYNSGRNRAKLAWYNIDPLFLRNESTTPDHIKNNPDLQSSHLVREINENEIFPKRENPNNINTNLYVLNLAYYPEERGPYNFDTDYIHEDGRLTNPENRWGGIMRKIETNDFEAANVEYIEFWMMDPFVEDSMNQGGDLYFNLGNISEDILKDSRKSFENGLPTSDEVALVDTTAWGRVPLTQSVVNAFDNDPQTRDFQDVGFDGLRDEDERLFFRRIETPYLDKIDSLHSAGIINDAAYNRILEDPSSDNFHYYRGGDYDDQQLGILDRYKRYNGPEGNSDTDEQSPESYTTSATNQPDVEDINRDNTLSEYESYYQYKVSLRPNDFVVGENYITDKREYTATFENEQESKVTWYQFKIPIKDFENRIGDIQDFKSIRFLRMFLRGWREDVVLRFATMDLVRGEWRKYNFSLMQPNLVQPFELGETSFEISAVNIEENASKEPVNYVLPPGIDRVIDPGNPQLRQLNEQSIVLKVKNLADGDARAAYKTAGMDVRKYKRLKMEVHAEALPEEVLEDDDLAVFIRLGSDYKSNFYEYEVPLKVTAPGSYNDESEEDRKIVWPEENRIDFAFELLQKAKQERNNQMRVAGSPVSLTSLFKYPSGDKMVSIMGNPNLSDVRTIMIGIRNRKNDGEPHSGEVWLNELRLTDFDEKGGWAAIGRVTTKLADFATVNMSGATYKPGFGSIEKKVSERNKDDIYQYDMSSNVELGKFFPQDAGVRIPMYVGYSRVTKNPEYNPLDPDIPFKVALEDPNLTAQERDSIKFMGQDFTERKSLNFTNVKVGGNKGKPSMFSISNVALSYAYSENFSRNINTEYDRIKNNTGGISYTYNGTPKNIQPLRNAKWARNKNLRFLRDFNFYYLPSMIAFRGNLNKTYQETRLRNLDMPELKITPNFRKDFNGIAAFDFKWDLSRSLKFDFKSTKNLSIEEPYGRIDKKNNLWEISEDTVYTYTQYRDSIWNNISDLTRFTNHKHDINVAWNVPINKLPFLDWVTLSARYSATYNWQAERVVVDTARMGNTIKNSRSLQINPRLNMRNLYNKVGFLKRIYNEYRRGKKKSNKKKTEKVNFNKTDFDFEENVATVIFHKLKTEDVDVKVVDSLGRPVEGEMIVINQNRVTFTAKKNVEKGTVVVEGTREIEESIIKEVLERTAYALMGVKSIGMSLNENRGTVLPGYMREAGIMGMDYSNQNMYAPGWGFITGQQDENFGRKAYENGWLSTSPYVSNPYMMTYMRNMTMRASIEPITNLRIELNAKHNKSTNYSVYYQYDAIEQAFKENNPLENGNFSMSYVAFGTAFKSLNEEDNWTSELFTKFLENREIISRRLAEQHPGVTGQESGYSDGFGQNSQSVLLPAFLSAYSNTDPNKVSLDPFPSIEHLRPNWRVTYNGLTKIDFVRQFLKKVTINHAYNCDYSIGNYQTNVDFRAGDDGFSMIRDMQSNYIPEFDIAAVSLNENLSPLIGIDMTWVNSVMTKIEYKGSRNLAFSVSSGQITEMITRQFVIGTGYRIPDLVVDITGVFPNARKKTYKSDLNLRLDFAIKERATVLRKIDGGNGMPVHTPTSGQKDFEIKSSADYMLSDRFNIRLYYDLNINSPKTSNTFKRSESNFGFSVRFALNG